MGLYCTKCGNGLKDNAVYCSKCGYPAQLEQCNRHQVIVQWKRNRFVDFLSKGSLELAKALLHILMGGAMIVTVVCSGLLIGIAVFLLYHYAAGISITIPTTLAGIMLVGNVQGFPLVCSGLMALFVAVIFLVMTRSLYQCMTNIYRKKKIVTGRKGIRNSYHAEKDRNGIQ